jgi:hypothetical protein
MREDKKEGTTEVGADKKGILNRTKSRFPKQIRNSSNPLPTSRESRCSYSPHPIVSPFIGVLSECREREGEMGLMIVWKDIAKVRMKINYKRFWMRLRISLDSGGSRCYREMKDRS